MTGRAGSASSRMTLFLPNASSALIACSSALGELTTLSAVEVEHEATATRASKTDSLASMRLDSDRGQEIALHAAAWYAASARARRDEHPGRPPMLLHDIRSNERAKPALASQP